jgi:hypothetical protein
VGAFVNNAIRLIFSFSHKSVSKVQLESFQIMLIKSTHQFNLARLFATLEAHHSFVSSFSTCNNGIGDSGFFLSVFQ